MSKQYGKKFGELKQCQTWVSRLWTHENKQAFVRGVIASAMMIPMWVPAQTSQAASATTVSAEDAQKYIRDFEIQVTGDQASISGQIFKDCNKQIEIRAFEEASGSKDNFVILDKGKFKSCMEKHKSESCLTAKAGSCVNVTSPKITLDDVAEIHLIQTVDGKDQVVKLASYESDAHRLTREGEEKKARDTAQAQAAAKAQQEAARTEDSRQKAAARAEVRALEHQFESCRKDLSEMEMAREAVGQLGNLKNLDASAMDDMLAELDKAEIDAFEKKIRKARDADKLDDLEDELVDFADAKCEQSDRLAEDLDAAQDSEDDAEDSSDAIERAEARMERQIDQVAALFHQLAVKRVNLGRESKDEGSHPDPIAENRAAAKTIELARKIECLPRQTKTELNRIQRDLSVDRCTTIAQQGSAYAFDLQQCMQNVSYGLAMDVQKYCAGAGANGMDCASARRAQMTVSQQIPNLYNQAVKKEQAQVQAMYQSFSAPPATATSGMPLIPNTGGSGYSWNGTNL